MANKNIMNLILSKGISSLGGVFTSFMLNLWLFDKTNSYIVFVFNTMAIALVPLLFSIPAGAISDKFRKDYLLIIADIFIVFSLVLLIFITRLDYFNIYLYIFVIVMIAIANEFRYTAMTAIIPELSEKEELIKYNGVQQIFRGASIVIAPMLGAVSYSFINIHNALGFSILAQLYSLYVLAGINYKHNKPYSNHKKNYNYNYALLWIFNNKALKFNLISFLLVSGVISAYMAISAPFILDGFGKKMLVATTTSQGIGLLLSGFIAFRLKNINEITLYQSSIFIIGLSILMIAMMTGLGLMMASFILGFGIGLLAASNQTIWQKYTPSDIQGRVIAIRTVSLYALSPFFIYITLPFTENISRRLVSYLEIYTPLAITILVLGLVVLIVSFFGFLIMKKWRVAHETEISS